MKRINILLVSGILGVMLMLLIFAISAFKNNRKNHFIRLFPPHSIWVSKRVDLKVNSYYFAGKSSSNVYLANYTNFNYIFYSNFDLSDTGHLLMHVPYFEGVNYDKVLTKIDFPHIWMFDPVGKFCLFGNIETDAFSAKRLLQSFAGLEVGSNSNLIYQTYDRINNTLLLNENNLTDSNSNHALYPLGSPADGLYGSDGKIHITENGRIVYVYRYKNIVLSLDSNLKLLNSFTTIDSNSVAKVKAKYIASQNKITMAKPPLVANEESVVDDALLYIKSPLLADNESKGDFERADPVDIYDLQKGMYKFSIYLPKLDGKGCKSFIVKGGYLVALYDHTLVSFKLNILGI
ncbi:hypothetical protein [Chitinophaga parva]|nr:hypothetical protein [Chitinophaga parva]